MQDFAYLFYYCSLGYKPFMMAIQGQVGVLTKLMTSKQQQHQLQQFQLHQQLHQQSLLQGIPSASNAAYSIEDSTNQVCVLVFYVLLNSQTHILNSYYKNKNSTLSQYAYFYYFRNVTTLRCHWLKWSVLW